MSRTHICPICGKSLDERDIYDVDFTHPDGFAHKKCTQNAPYEYDEREQDPND